MSNDLMRFSVAMPEDLLVRFDRLVARRGLAKNRSEVVRDLVRDALVEEECSTPGAEVMGTLTIVFDHHASDLQEKLHAIQHEYFESIVSSMHVHLDEHNCLGGHRAARRNGARAGYREPHLGYEGREERAPRSYDHRTVYIGRALRRPDSHRSGSTLRLRVMPDLILYSLALSCEARPAAKQGRSRAPREPSPTLQDVRCFT